MATKNGLSKQELIELIDSLPDVCYAVTVGLHRPGRFCNTAISKSLFPPCPNFPKGISLQKGDELEITISGPH